MERLPKQQPGEGLVQGFGGKKNNQGEEDVDEIRLDDERRNNTGPGR